MTLKVDRSMLQMHISTLKIGTFSISCTDKHTDVTKNNIYSASTADAQVKIEHKKREWKGAG